MIVRNRLFFSTKYFCSIQETITKKRTVKKIPVYQINYNGGELFQLSRK